MTSQEQTIKRREANARKWAARQARWAAWKAKQAKKQGLHFHTFSLQELTMVALFNTFCDKWNGLHMDCDSLCVDIENPDSPFCSMDSFNNIVIYMDMGYEYI